MGSLRQVYLLAVQANSITDHLKRFDAVRVPESCRGVVEAQVAKLEAVRSVIWNTMISLAVSGIEMDENGLKALLDKQAGDSLALMEMEKVATALKMDSELKIHLAAFRYATPQMEEDKGPINHPQYPGDVGLDVSLPKDLALFPHQTVSVTLTVPPPSIPHHRPTIFGRSGLAMQGILVKPCRWRQGGVDVSLTNFSDQTVFLNKYRRFCQLVYLHKHHLTSFYSPHSDAGVLGPRSLFRWASCAFEEVPGLAMGDSGLSEALEGRQGRGFGSSGQ